MDEPKPPKVFANHVILQMAKHSLADNCEPTAKDYLLMRTAYRSLGGTWDALLQGDLKAFDMLRKVVSNWGKTYRKKEPEFI